MQRGRIHYNFVGCYNFVGESFALNKIWRRDPHFGIRVPRVQNVPATFLHGAKATQPRSSSVPGPFWIPFGVRVGARVRISGWIVMCLRQYLDPMLSSRSSHFVVFAC